MKMDINIEDFSTRGSAQDGNVVTIFTKKIINNFKSKQEGELVFEYRPYLEIVSPGQRHSTVIREFKDSDKDLYPKHWEAYQKKEQLRNAGTPLSEWPNLPQEMIPEMEYYGIYTVQDVANLADANLKHIGLGAAKIREQARDFLAGNTEADLKLQAALDRISELEAKLEATGAVEANPDVSETDEQENEPTIDSSGHTKRNWGF